MISKLYAKTHAGRSALRCALFAATAAFACTAAAAAVFPLHVLRQVPITASGTPQALAFASDGALAYLAVGRSLAVYDAATAAAAGVLALPGTAVDLAMAARGDTAYVALQDPDAVAVVSLRPLRVVRTLRLPVAPSALLVDLDGRYLYVESAAAGRVLQIDAASGRSIGEARLAGRLQQMAQNDYGQLFVAVADRDAVDVLDTQPLRFAGTVPMANCRAPSGAAIDPVGRRLFVSCASGVAVVDTDIGFTFQQLPAPAGGRTRALFVRSPKGADGWKGAAFFAGENGVLSAVRMLAFIKYADGGHLTLAAGADALAFDAARGQLWLALPKSTAGADTASSSLLILGGSAAASAPGDGE